VNKAHPRPWLYAWNFARDCGRFLSLDRETLHRSSFLDQRIATDAANFTEVPIAALLDRHVGDDANRPAGFIFHTAFCCSTLLARSLDLPGRSLVLREPATLLQLADLKRGLTASARGVAELLPPTLALLARPFDARERLIIKPTNLATNMAPELFAANADSRALVLHDGLEPFLLAVLKRPRESERGIGQFLHRLLADPAGQTWANNHLPPRGLAERAALAWSLQIRALKTWLATENPDRVRLFATNELLARPAEALVAGATWLGMELTTREAEAIARGPLWMRHAKDPAVPFDPARRREEQARARRLLADPLRDGMAWAEKNGCAASADFAESLRLLAYRSY
jgi:hypothetical protein